MAVAVVITSFFQTRIKFVSVNCYADDFLEKCMYADGQTEIRTTSFKYFKFSLYVLRIISKYMLINVYKFTIKKGLYHTGFRLSLELCKNKGI